MGKAFTRGVKAFILIQHVKAGWGGCGRWKDYEQLPGGTRHAFAQITEQEPCIDNNTRVRTPDKRTHGTEEAVKTTEPESYVLREK